MKIIVYMLYFYSSNYCLWNLLKIPISIESGLSWKDHQVKKTNLLRVKIEKMYFKYIIIIGENGRKTTKNCFIQSLRNFVN